MTQIKFMYVLSEIYEAFNDTNILVHSRPKSKYLISLLNFHTNIKLYLCHENCVNIKFELY